MKLLDIADLEAFCERAIQRSGITEFGYLDHDDLLAELVAFCWELSADHDPARAKFSTFAGGCCSNFIIEWKRSDFRTRWTFGDGRVYERAKPVFVEYDGAFGETAMDPIERGDPDSARLDAAGTISASAYSPPSYLRSARGAEGAPDGQTSRHKRPDREAA